MPMVMASFGHGVTNETLYFRSKIVNGYPEVFPEDEKGAAETSGLRSSFFQALNENRRGAICASSRRHFP